MPGNILIIDDDRSVIASLSLLFKQAGHRPCSAGSPAEALRQVEGEELHLVVQDMNFSRKTTGGEGLDLLREIRRRRPSLPVILITAWGSIELAVRGMQLGAADFITKPWSNPRLLQTVQTALGLAAARSGDSGPLSREQLDAAGDFAGVVGRDPRLLKILHLVHRVADTDASVLITGESGTGKELIAAAVHQNSRRKEKPFVKVNLAGIPPGLFESEMFGHIKGAFTDARQNRQGRFERADGGTIFLDEIGDLDAGAQAKLLRVLQDQTFEPLGSSNTRGVDVRVISATNRNLQERVARGEFREDLLYRLNLIALHLPALRERPGDIPLLAEHFLAGVGRVYRRSNLALSVEARQWLQRHPWPGNIRQLKHLIERGVLVSGRDTLGVEDFLLPAAMEAVSEPEPGVALPVAGSMTLEEMERAMIVKCLDSYDGNISKVAEALGLSRASLYRRLEKYGIQA